MKLPAGSCGELQEWNASTRALSKNRKALQHEI